MKQVFLIFVYIIVSVCFCFAKIDIGEEIKVKRIYNTNLVNFSNMAIDTETNSIQRIRLYLQGNLQKNITARVQLQAIGLWGSSDTVRINGYEYSSFQPFIEHAYVKFDKIIVLSEFLYCNLSVGKQPFYYGDGYIVSDNNRGLFGYKIDGNLTKTIAADLFSIKADEKDISFTAPKKSVDVNGVILSYTAKEGITPSLYYILEFNSSDTIDLVSSYSKNYYGLRIDGLSKEKVKYKLEFAKQDGNVHYSNSPTKRADAYFYDVGISFDFWISFLKRTQITLDYLYASGNDLKVEEDFDPYLTNRKKEKGDIYYGEIFSRMHQRLANKKLMYAGLNFEVMKNLGIFIKYFNFWQNNPGGFLGNEINVGLTRKYRKSVDVRLIYGILKPGDLLKKKSGNTANLNHMSLEFIYKF